MLLTNARAFFLDEVSTGLDAAVTLHIFSALKQACAINNASVVTALLQPTPETYGLFDDIILMVSERTQAQRHPLLETVPSKCHCSKAFLLLSLVCVCLQRDGYVVYHGPRDAIPEWLWEVAGLEVPHGVDEAGFLVDYLSDPQAQYDAADKARGLGQKEHEHTPEQSKLKQSAPLMVKTADPTVNGANGTNGVNGHHGANGTTNGVNGATNGANGRHSRTTSAVRFHQGNPVEPAEPEEAEGLLSQDSAAAAVAASDIAPPTPHVQENGAAQGSTLSVVPFPASSERSLAPSPSAASASALQPPRKKGLAHGMSSSSFAPMYHSRASASPVTSADELNTRYKASPFYAAMATEVGVTQSTAAPLDASQWNEYTRNSYATSYPHSTARHTKLNLSRQLKLTVRNRTMVPPRIAQALVMGSVAQARTLHGESVKRAPLWFGQRLICLHHFVLCLCVCFAV